MGHVGSRLVLAHLVGLLRVRSGPLGTYFAVNASYSHNYAYNEASLSALGDACIDLRDIPCLFQSNGFRTMFVAKVIAGDTADIQPDDSYVCVCVAQRCERTMMVQTDAAAIER